MPTYEYQCEACKHRFEKFQSITAAPIRKCPNCGKARVRRLLSAGGGIIFKGSGFYITDYRDKSYAEKAKADSGAPASDSSKSSSEGTSDAKPTTGDMAAKPAETKAAGEPAAKTPAAPKSEPKASKSAKK